MKYFSYFSQNIGFDSSETICMKCRILFSGKNKKNLVNLSTAESGHSMVSDLYTLIHYTAFLSI